MLGRTVSSDVVQTLPPEVTQGLFPGGHPLSEIVAQSVPAEPHLWGCTCHRIQQWSFHQQMGVMIAGLQVAGWVAYRNLEFWSEGTLSMDFGKVDNRLVGNWLVDTQWEGKSEMELEGWEIAFQLVWQRWVEHLSRDFQWQVWAFFLVSSTDPPLTVDLLMMIYWCSSQSQSNKFSTWRKIHTICTAQCFFIMSISTKWCSVGRWKKHWTVACSGTPQHPSGYCLSIFAMIPSTVESNPD